MPFAILYLLLNSNIIIFGLVPLHMILTFNMLTYGRKLTEHITSISIESFELFESIKFGQINQYQMEIINMGITMIFLKLCSSLLELYVKSMISSNIGDIINHVHYKINPKRNVLYYENMIVHILLNIPSTIIFMCYYTYNILLFSYMMLIVLSSISIIMVYLTNLLNVKKNINKLLLEQKEQHLIDLLHNKEEQNKENKELLIQMELRDNLRYNQYIYNILINLVNDITIKLSMYLIAFIGAICFANKTMNKTEVLFLVFNSGSFITHLNELNGIVKEYFK